MKKEPQNNTKLTDYFSLKGINPLARVLNKAPLASVHSSKNHARKSSKRQGRSDEGESDHTIVLEEVQKKVEKFVCKQMIMIGPCDTSYYESTQKKISQVQASYSKDAFMKFLMENAKFHNCHNLIILDSIKDEIFWGKTLPAMLDYARSREKQQSISACIPTLTAGTHNMIELTKAQILMILINLFLCILPWQTCRSYLSFSGLLGTREKDRESLVKLKFQKLRCFINYFNIMMEKSYKDLRNETVTLQRVFREVKKDQILNQTCGLAEVKIKRGLIEEEYKKSIMVDFANKNIGGGVLNNGAVQEEILFCVFPQLVATMCLCEEIRDNEAVVISNVTRINRSSGYSEQFKYEGSFYAEPEGQGFLSVIVAIDAIDFSQKICKGQGQYAPAAIHREIVKALIGFEGAELQADSQMPICTGRWGCGAFKGDSYLKFIIQWVACSIAKRKLIYMAQSDQEQKQLKVMVKYLQKHDASQIIEAISEYNNVMKKNKKLNFLDFLKHEIS